MSRSAHVALSASMFLLALTGCQQQAAPAVSPNAQLGAATKPEEIPAEASSTLSVEPAKIADCGTMVVATVRWNANPTVVTKSTQIWTGADDANLKLFNEGAAMGETQTGRWTQPGTRFVLKNKEDGKVLGHATVGGPKCL